MLLSRSLQLPVGAEEGRTVVESVEQRRVSLVRSHLRDVWNFLRRLGLSPEDAEDATQEVLLVAVQKIDRIEAGRERAFLFGVAVRTASRSRRSTKTRAEKTPLTSELDDVVSEAPSSYDIVERKEARALLDEALDDLKPELRAVFVLFELEEMTLAEISTLLEIPAGTVASRVARAREQFLLATKRMKSRQR